MYTKPTLRAAADFDVEGLDDDGDAEPLGVELPLLEGSCFLPPAKAETANAQIMNKVINFFIL
jgi:hypothetical protein